MIFNSSLESHSQPFFEKNSQPVLVKGHADIFSWRKNNAWKNSFNDLQKGKSHAELHGWENTDVVNIFFSQDDQYRLDALRPVIEPAIPAIPAVEAKLGVIPDPIFVNKTTRDVTAQNVNEPSSVYIPDPPLPRYTGYINTDFVGGDIQKDNDIDYSNCEAKCESLEGCVGYVTHKDSANGKGCWFKREKKNIVPNRINRDGFFKI